MECGDRTELVTALSEQFAEVRQAQALNNQGLLIEVFANERTGPWTILVIQPDGVTCIGAHGEAWTTIPRGRPL